MINEDVIAPAEPAVKIPDYHEMKRILALIATEAKLEEAMSLDYYLVPCGGKMILHALLQRLPDADINQWSARQLHAVMARDLAELEEQLQTLGQLATDLRAQLADVAGVLS